MVIEVPRWGAVPLPTLASAYCRPVGDVAKVSPELPPSAAWAGCGRSNSEAIPALTVALDPRRAAVAAEDTGAAVRIDLRTEQKSAEEASPSVATVGGTAARGGWG